MYEEKADDVFQNVQGAESKTKTNKMEKRKKKNSYFGSIFFSLSNDFETSPTALEVYWPVSLVQGLTFHV